MKFLSSLIVLAGAVAAGVASPVENGATPVGRPVPAKGAARAGTPSSEGTHDGFFYSWWSDQQGDTTYK